MLIIPPTKLNSSSSITISVLSGKEKGQAGLIKDDQFFFPHVGDLMNRFWYIKKKKSIYNILKVGGMC